MFASKLAVRSDKYVLAGAKGRVKLNTSPWPEVSASRSMMADVAIRRTVCASGAEDEKVMGSEGRSSLSVFAMVEMFLLVSSARTVNISSLGPSEERKLHLRKDSTPPRFLSRGLRRHFFFGCSPATSRSSDKPVNLKSSEWKLKMSTSGDLARGRAAGGACVVLGRVSIGEEIKSITIGMTNGALNISESTAAKTPYTPPLRLLYPWRQDVVLAASSILVLVITATGQITNIFLVENCKCLVYFTRSCILLYYVLHTY